MKRSEMTEVIRELIRDESGYWMNNEEIRNIIQGIEKHMIPKCGGSHQSSYDLAMGNSPEWEEE